MLKDDHLKARQSTALPCLEKRSPNLAQPEPKPLGLFGQMASTAAGVAVGSVVVRRVVSLIPVDRLPLAPQDGVETASGFR